MLEFSEGPRVADSKQESVLLVADRKSSQTARFLKRAGYDVVATFTVDHAVALCVNRDYVAVVLDHALFIEVDNWNVAQSLKLVRPRLQVILVNRGTPPLDGKSPKGVDGQIPQRQLSKLPDLLRRLLSP